MLDYIDCMSNEEEPLEGSDPINNENNNDTRVATHSEVLNSSHFTPNIISGSAQGKCQKYLLQLSYISFCEKLNELYYSLCISCF